MAAKIELFFQNEEILCQLGEEAHVQKHSSVMVNLPDC